MTDPTARPGPGDGATLRGTGTPAGPLHRPLLGRRIARFNRSVTNKVAVHVAGVVPGLGIVIHVGRRTRTVYRTPVMVFAAPNGFRVALTYGSDSDWVRNALAHGAVRLIARRRSYELRNPEVVVDPARRNVPWIVRGALSVLRVAEFLDLQRLDDGGTGLTR